MTDPSGAFTCGGLAGGTYNATVFPSSGAVHAFRFVEPPPKIELRDGDSRVDGVRLVIEPTLLAIDGRVLDGFGVPLSDVRVHAFLVDRRKLNLRMIPVAITDEDGRFRIAQLSTGNYHLEAKSGGHAIRRTIAAGATNIALVLDRSPCEGAGGHEVPSTFARPAARTVWDHQIELVGWLLPTTATMGVPFEMTLVYRALRPVDREWAMFAHFDSPSVRLNADHEPGIGWCPTTRWQAGETIVDRVTAQFESAGKYALTIGFFTGRAPDWVNLPISTAPGATGNKPRHGVHIADVIVE